MSWSPVRGRSRTEASSLISGAYCSSTSIVTTACPSTSSTSEMSPALTPAMFTVWPWPGHDRLRGRELGLELEPLVAEERDPGRVRLLLLGEDDPGRPEAEHDQHADRDEVAQVLPDRAPHGAATSPTGVAGVRSGAADGRRGAVDRGQRVLVAGDVEAERRRRARQRRLHALRGDDRVAVERLVVEPAARVRDREQLVAAARLEADVGPVAVERLALAGELDGPVEELVEVRLPGRERVVDDDVAGRDEDLARCSG